MQYILNQQEVFEILGYSNWLPQTYALNDVVINPGNSILYISLIANNTTAPAQPGAQWAIVTVAQLIATSNMASVLQTLGYLPWSGTTPYSQNEGVVHNGNICISSIPGTNTNVGNTPGSMSDSNWGVYTLFEVYQRWILNNMVVHP